MKRILPVIMMLAIMAVACIKVETADVEDIPGEETVLNLCPGGEILEVSD